MSIVESITGVFSDIGTWITGQLTTVSALFYVPETGLTFLGVLAVCGLGFSVIFMLINVIQGFLHFRG